MKSRTPGQTSGPSYLCWKQVEGSGDSCIMVTVCRGQQAGPELCTWIAALEHPIRCVSNLLSSGCSSISTPVDAQGDSDQEPGDYSSGLRLQRKPGWRFSSFKLCDPGQPLHP